MYIHLVHIITEEVGGGTDCSHPAYYLSSAQYASSKKFYFSFADCFQKIKNKRILILKTIKTDSSQGQYINIDC